MRRPPARPFTGRDKWGHVALYAVIAALGALLAWGAMVVDSESPLLRVLATYTLVGVALTLALAVAFAVTTRLPVLEESTFEGAPAQRLHAFSGEWWHSLALDLAIATGAFVLAVMGVRAGNDLAVPGLVVGAVGAWWLVRALLGLTARRNNSGLWLTDRELVLESREGRLRCPRSEITGATSRDGWGLVVGMRDGARSERCPWPWRPRTTRLGEHIAVVDLRLTAHEPADVAAWLTQELGLEAPADPSTGGESPNSRRKARP